VRNKLGCNPHRWAKNVANDKWRHLRLSEALCTAVLATVLFELSSPPHTCQHDGTSRVVSSCAIMQCGVGFMFYSVKCTNVTDRQTDRQTSHDGIDRACA